MELCGYNYDFKSRKAVLAPNINGPDKEKKRSTVVVHFTIQTRKDEYHDLSLRKVVGPTRIDGYMERLIVIDNRGPALV